MSIKSCSHHIQGSPFVRGTWSAAHMASHTFPDCFSTSSEYLVGARTVSAALGRMQSWQDLEPLSDSAWLARRYLTLHGSLLEQLGQQTANLAPEHPTKICGAKGQEAGFLGQDMWPARGLPLGVRTALVLTPASCGALRQWNEWRQRHGTAILRAQSCKTFLCLSRTKSQTIN